MNSPIIQILILVGIAGFLILRLRSVLGTREGFEQSPVPVQRRGPELEVIEGGVDPDIADHTDGKPDAAEALAQMKRAEPSFNVTEFLSGARGAYEMILMGFERGDLADIKPFLSDDVYASFAEVVDMRDKQGLSVDVNFIGIREMMLDDATFEEGVGEITVRFIGEMTSVVRDAAGEIVEGSETQVKRQKDVWTFARSMGADDPNWLLVATGE